MSDFLSNETWIGTQSGLGCWLVTAAYKPLDSVSQWSCRDHKIWGLTSDLFSWPCSSAYKAESSNIPCLLPQWTSLLCLLASWLILIWAVANCSFTSPQSPFCDSPESEIETPYHFETGIVTDLTPLASGFWQSQSTSTFWWALPHLLTISLTKQLPDFFLQVIHRNMNHDWFSAPISSKFFSKLSTLISMNAHVATIWAPLEPGALMPKS